MQEHQNNTVKRILFASLMVIAAALLIFAHYEIHRGVNYNGSGEQVDHLSDSTDNTSEPLPGIDEPEGLNHVIHLTVGGNCTPAAVLGTDSFGSFNRMAAEEGGAVFFEKLKKVFAEDDCMILGCAAVLSEREFDLGELQLDELPNFGPSKNAEVFSLSSADVLSLAHARTAVCGEEGIADTKAALEQQNLSWTDGETPVYLELYGVRIGILGAQIFPEEETLLLEETVSAAAESCDYLIMYAEPQWSMEDRETEEEFYTELARLFISAGCDLVCYTGYASEGGPSVEEYGDGVIVTSLGYLLDGSTYEGGNTALYTISISVNDGVIETVKGELVPVVFGENPWIPALK